MNIGVVGLGKMGAQIAQKLARAGFDVTGFDPHIKTLESTTAPHIKLVNSLKTLAQKADTIWLMIPAGQAVDECLNELMVDVKKNCIIIDGGNSFYKDSIRRAALLKSKEIEFLDCGTSGGTHGLENGFSLMIGGNQEAYERCYPFFQTLATPDGCGHVGPAGAGHFVKMVHNGIEYGLLQAYAEGLHVLREGPYQNLDLAGITNIWQNGAVIRSWLLSLAHTVLSKDQTLKNISGFIDENKTGKWTLDTAQEFKIPTPVIEASLQTRAWSRSTGGNFGTKIIAMLRNAFGGHAIKKDN